MLNSAEWQGQISSLEFLYKYDVNFFTVKEAIASYLIVELSYRIT